METHSFLGRGKGWGSPLRYNTNMSLKTLLSKLEDSLQSLVEGGAGRIFPTQNLAQELGPRLEEALRLGVQAGADGEALAPNLFSITLPPAQCQAAMEDTALLQALLGRAGAAAARLDCCFPAPVVIKFVPSAEPGGPPQVMARLDLNGISDTTALEVEPPEAGEAPAGAYLVVNGLEIVPLSLPALTLGRDPSSGLVVDDPRVSRAHAQLRLAHGRYVIFDLESTGGTFVNGRPVSRQELLPGDVISLAGVPLVYGEESSQVAGPTEEILPEA